MDKEDFLEEFFRAFKVTLTNAFSYSKDHPYFIKSVENLKIKLETVLQFYNPLKIGITDKTIFIDGKAWVKSGSYDDLARLLHQRKIKSVQLIPGLTNNELIELLTLFSLPPKDILQAGGAVKISEEKRLNHVVIEDLDYSLFLAEKGKAADSDIWGYLFKSALTKDNADKINTVADNFENMLFVKGLDLLAEKEFPKSVNDLLIYLKNNDRTRFEKCAKDLFLWFMQNKKLLNDERIEKARQILRSLSKDDFADLLLGGLSSDVEFDSLSLQLFAKISDKEKQEDVARGFLDKINDSQLLRKDPRLAKKIQGLLANPQEDQISAVYRNTLNLLLKEVSFTGSLFFDRLGLKENFRYVILNLLVQEKDRKALVSICLILNKELEGVFTEKSLDYLVDLSGFLFSSGNECADLFLPLKKKIGEFVENAIWELPYSAELENLVSKLDKLNYGADFYLSKIFQEGKFNTFCLRLFFRFFGQNLSEFYLALNAKRADVEFLVTFLKALEEIDCESVNLTLKYIYNLANLFVKIEALKAMRKQKLDYAFILSVLSSDSLAIKKEALVLLSRDTVWLKEGFVILLNIPNNWGRHNVLLIENMRLINELGLKQAADYIRSLSKRRFFWNKNLRIEAQEILKGWNVN